MKQTHPLHTIISVLIVLSRTVCFFFVTCQAKKNKKWKRTENRCCMTEQTGELMENFWLWSNGNP